MRYDIGMEWDSTVRHGLVVLIGVGMGPLSLPAEPIGPCRTNIPS